ncbi:Probable inactive histone-lysine N-methyltransferase SUVR2 [Linum grandiflorum]
MPPNPRVGKALKAMRELGFGADVVKPVLSTLGKLYNKNFSLIEEDNYRALVDAILNDMEGKERDSDEEPQPLLKRRRPRRVRDQEGLAAVSPEDPAISTNKRNALAPAVSNGTLPSEQQDDVLVTKGKEPMPSHDSARSRYKRSLAVRRQLSIRIEEPAKSKVGDPYSLTVPKDEPLDELPLAVIMPECSNENPPEEGNGLPSELEIASSSSGEVKISLSFQPLLGRPSFQIPALDQVLKSTEERHSQHRLLGENLSVLPIMKEMCQCFLELATDSGSSVPRSEASLSANSTMAPNPKVTKAFKAMEDLGFEKASVKRVLRNLLKLYDKNFALIEEDNYRALADAVLDDMEKQAQASEKEKEKEKETVDEENIEEEGQDEELQRPLKRLRPHRLRDQEALVSPSSGNHSPPTNGNLLIQPKLEQEDPPSDNCFQLATNKKNALVPAVSPQDHAASSASQPLSVQRNSSQEPVTNGTVPSEQCSPQDLLVTKGKEPISSEASVRGKRRRAGREPTVRLDQSSKRKDDALYPLIVPKDEPFTDAMPLNELPLAVMGPDSSNENSTVRGMITEDEAGQKGRTEGDDSALVTSKTPGVRADVGSNSNVLSSSLEIASSPSGEVKMSLNFQPLLGRPSFQMPTLDELLKSVEERCSRHNFHDENFSVLQIMKDMCQCFLELATDSSHESQERVSNETQPDDSVTKSRASNALCVLDTAGNSDPASDSSSQTVRPILDIPKLANTIGEHGIPRSVLDNGGGTRLVDSGPSSLAVVPQCQLATNGLRSLHDMDDIAKAEESVKIPWFNDVNNECPPSFHYLPENHVFQNALVRFTLAQITADNCCSSCVGDCLSSSSPCCCVAETLNGYAYTPEGLLKDDLLQECISMARDPQQQYLFYCTDCPLEKCRNEEMIDPCKGHLKRKFIKECWRKCGCHKNCGNRVVQRGIRRKLQVFFTSDGKGWGLRTLEKLPKGSFVCEYIGEILTIKEWHRRTSKISRSTKIENPSSVHLDAYWNSREARALKDEEFLCLDATYYGNIAKFINHRCLDANLIEIPVKIETPEHHYYHLAFFTTREVDALEELTWDYGIDFDDNDQALKRFECKCGSKFCRKMKRSSSEFPDDSDLGIWSADDHGTKNGSLYNL